MGNPRWRKITRVRMQKCEASYGEHTVQCGTRVFEHAQDVRSKLDDSNLEAQLPIRLYCPNYKAMPDYDFKSLSSVDFENLVRDVLQKELNITLESFKTGRDRGIDMRYCTAVQGSLIVQCKHYANTAYATLLSELKNKEKPKVRRLKPSRYILTTSIGLTPDNKDELAGLFGIPTSDVYGKSDLNNLLGKFPEVERQHFKLWLTSLPVLERVIHSAVFNQTEADLEQIQKKLKYYVQNRSFFEAVRILEEDHYCIIAGIPGIGKTTLAEVLLVNYIGQGFEGFSITDDISEAFDVYNKAKRQVFYFDDFLGQSRIGDKPAYRDEGRNLLRFIESVRGSNNTRFILTTREYILDQAKEEYERLSNSNFDVRRCVISLADYSPLERAKILFNHVYFSSFPVPYKQALLDGKSYRRIIGHPNFSPRIVEWMTDYLIGLKIDASEYVQHFESNLDNPTRLWEHAFDKQLTSPARHLLLVLASLPRDVRLEDLESAFTSFHEYSARRHNLQTGPRDFIRALKELESNFARTERRHSDTIVRFHNPSIRDFLENRLAASPAEVAELCEAAVFFEQFITLWGIGSSRAKTGASGTGAPAVPPNISRQTDTFFQGMLRTFDSGDYSNKVEHYSGGGYRVTYERRHLALESRIRFALSAAGAVYGQRLFEEAGFLLRPMFDRLIQVLGSNTGDKAALLALLHDLQGEGLRRGSDSGAIPANLLTTAKGFLMQWLHTLEAFAQFLDFEHSFKGVVTEQDHSRMADEFNNFYEPEVNYVLGDYAEDIDPDSMRHFADELARIAFCLGVDVDEDVSSLREHADEWEERISEQPHDDQNHMGGYSSRPVGSAAGGDIDSMFEALLE
jgi:DNA polymerase III delta prime subunit